MNTLQAKEKALLEIFIGLCEKLRLPYYLVCGSALGAVKYQGFIPWDDDIDVGLLRQDYESFLEKAPALLPDGVFLQNYRTDPAFPLLMSKLRASDTAYIEQDKAGLPIHHGIFIDIFPIDGYPKSKAAQWRLEWAKLTARWKYSCVLEYPRHYHRVRLRNGFFRLLGYHRKTAAVLARLERRLCRYSPEVSDLWCNHGNWQGRLEYAPRWHYAEGARAEFEGLQVRIPKNFDAYLTQKYGPWRDDLPQTQKRGHHPYTVCDTQRSYTFYTKRG